METPIVVSYETAKLLKDTELNSWRYSSGAYASKDHTTKRWCSGDFEYQYTDFKEGELKNPDVLKHKIYAPHQHLVQKWLREEHDTLVLVDANQFFLYWKILIPDHELPARKKAEKAFNTYEAALEEGLQEAIKLIKKQENQ